MGRGIGAVVQLEFSMESFSCERDSKEYFSDGFFDFYNCETDDRNHIFKIKEDFLLANYGDFLSEFYQTIGEDLLECTEISPDDSLLKLKDMSSFVEAFDRRSGVPSITTSRYDISVLGGDSRSSWLFYLGSYKADLEEYSTFTHVERMLAKAMKNPLAKLVKFCIRG
ncbi:hypothetical protein FACS189472_04220 [Alphaproteobacteria bacterium]|nr:hypothetical protein FACS189472_04220 [Alphaproteobacteria bacterium]